MPTKTVELTSVLLALLALVGTSLPVVHVPAIAGKTKKARPPMPEDLVGVWIGFWEDEEFTRLDLRPEFTRYCA